MTMTSPMTPLLCVLWVRRWLRRPQSEHESVCHMWCTRCQQRSMRYCMTERTLSARLAPSLMRLHHFDLCWVSSSKFKDQWSNLRKISGQVRIIRVGFQLFKLFLVTVKAVSRDVREYWFMARALIVECFELTTASDYCQIWTFQLP